MRTHTHVLTGVLLLVVAAAALIAVLDTEPADRPGADGVLELTITDYQLEPAEFTLPAEEPVRLVITNTDNHDHDLTIGRGVVEQTGRPARFEQCFFAEAEASATPSQALIAPSESVPAATVSIDAESTVTLEVSAPAELAGTWQVGCFIGPGCDYRMTLTGELTIEPPADGQGRPDRA
ncbi:MAG: cupredoxin domain-containing protein [Nitriliruptoraceae bacterium]